VPADIAEACRNPDVQWRGAIAVELQPRSYTNQSGACR